MGNTKPNVWVGWQGVVVKLPADWSLNVIGGEEKSGYFRVDSTGSLVFEAKWWKADSKYSIEANVQRYLDDLRKRAKKRNVEFDSKLKIRDDRNVSYSWSSDRRAQGRAWLCEKCKRLVMVQLSGEPKDNVSDLASVILPGVVDHVEDGWKRWGVYELVADVPPGYEMVKQQMMSGYIQLVFRKGSNLLALERWGIANVALRKQGLVQWLNERVGYDLKGFKYSVEEADTGEGPGIVMNGRRRSLREHLKSVLEMLTLRRPAAALDGLIWVCEQSNRIYSVQTIHTSKEDVLDEVYKKVQCH